MDDAEEGQRELGFYNQALAAVKSAQAGLDLPVAPHTRLSRPHPPSPALIRPHDGLSRPRPPVVACTLQCTLQQTL